MSKAVSKNYHWLPKTGRYTIRLNRRGDIGQTLPKEAQEQLFADLLDRTNRTQAEIGDLELALRKVRIDSLRAPIMKRKIQLERELKNLRFERHLSYLPRYADAFLAAARLLLDSQTIARIDAVCVAKIGYPARYWQQFLGDNGYGVHDSSMYPDSQSAKQSIKD